MGLDQSHLRRSEAKPGDHIYTWRFASSYSHHGIYIGGGKVVHFTSGNSGGSASSSALSAVSSSASARCPTCATLPTAGVIQTCLDCFLDGDSLYLFKYGVKPKLLSMSRAGTYSTFQSDPADTVLHRAMYLLANGFGSYNLLTHNCEVFAFYCKTGLLSGINVASFGTSEQVNNAVTDDTPGMALMRWAVFGSNIPASPVVRVELEYLAEFLAQRDRH